MLGQTHLHMQLACVWLPWVEGPVGAGLCGSVERKAAERLFFLTCKPQGPRF